MGLSDARLRELASEMAAAMGSPPKPKQGLRVVGAQPETRDRAIFRDAMLGRIRDLRDMYRLHWLVRQETFGRGQLENLDDSDLSALLSMMEKARECIRDDVPFEEQGLIRLTTHDD